jgi:hypothetical protein
MIGMVNGRLEERIEIVMRERSLATSPWIPCAPEAIAGSFNA